MQREKQAKEKQTTLFKVQTEFYDFFSNLKKKSTK